MVNGQGVQILKGDCRKNMLKIKVIVLPVCMFTSVCKEDGYSLFLNLTTLWANSADDKLIIFFSFLKTNRQDLTFHANFLSWRQFA